MEIKYPHFKNTEAVEAIYDEYSDLSPLSHFEASFTRDNNNASGEYRFDKILCRRGKAEGDPNHGGNDDGDAILTRSRALYMFEHDASVIGFGGRAAYCQPLGAKGLFSLCFYYNDTELQFTENTAARVNCPSYWHGEYEAGSITVSVDKFFGAQNSAAALLSIHNNGESDAEITVTATSPFVSRPWTVYPGNKAQGELRGRMQIRDDLTTLTAKLTMSDSYASYPHRRNHRPDAGAVAEQAKPWEEYLCLCRKLSVSAGQSAALDAVFGAVSEEIPESDKEYLRLAEMSGADHDATLRTQKREYNKFWDETVPYIDVPDPAIKKAIDYRFWLERFNVLDANIPGHDYQYPITMEGVLGYNNAIVLTQCMHLQDTKWQRKPYLPYGQLLSVGSCSGGSAFLDNPGNRRNWNNHYGQYLAQAGIEAFRVHGGGRQLALTLARWFHGDAKGQLEHYGNHTSATTPKQNLISYRNNYMTGNDADTVSMHYDGVGRFKTHAENAYVFGAASAAAQLYALAGEEKLAAECKSLAEDIRADIIKYLWCDKCSSFETRAVEPEESFVAHNPDKPNLVPLKESNNYNYFALGVPPTDEESLKKFRPAFRFLADPEEFPIFPYYTASQRDNKLCPGSNNFSNINFNVQARAYEAALRTYDTEHEYVTPEMLSSMVAWCAWNMYPDGGDTKYPNNSEFFNADRASDPCGAGDYYRSWIYHNILGNYNYIFIEDMAGLRPRDDKKIELAPIDFGYGHFAADNMRYHGADISIIWNGDGKYDAAGIPAGYSLYINGGRVLTLDRPAKVIYDTVSGTAETAANVIFITGCLPLQDTLSCCVSDPDSRRLLSLAGINDRDNLALGAAVTASYTPATARDALFAEKHRADGRDETSEAINEAAPDPAAVTDGKCECSPFWGNYGSTASFDTLEIKLDGIKKIDTLAAYFYDDRQKDGYSYPRRYQIEYLHGDTGEWKRVTTRSQQPRYMTPNLNISRFDAVETDRVRLHFYNRLHHSTAVTEIELYYEGTPRSQVINYVPEVYPDSADLGGLRARLCVHVRDDGMPFESELTCHWSLGGLPEGVSARIADPDCEDTILSVSAPGRYYATLHVTDGETRRHCGVAIDIKQSEDTLYDLAPASSVTTDFSSDWENASGVVNPKNEPRRSSMGAGRGWGTWGSPDETHALTLTWGEPVTVSSADIYWYADGGGIKLPESYELLYAGADGAYIPVTYKGELEIAADKYNRVEFEAVYTRALRIVCKSTVGAVGIYRFKAYAPAIAELPAIKCAVKAGDSPKLPSRVFALSEYGDPIALDVAWFDGGLDTSADGDYTVSGVTAPLTRQISATVYVRSDMDAATVTEADAVKVSVRRNMTPSLPKFASVHYNNGASDNITLPAVWSDAASAPHKDVGSYTIMDAGRIEGADISLTLSLNVFEGGGAAGDVK